jgi:hypothetical protein
MAGVPKKVNGWHCTFRYQGRRYYFAVGKVSEDQARAKGAEVHKTLALLELGRRWCTG